MQPLGCVPGTLWAATRRPMEDVVDRYGSHRIAPHRPVPGGSSWSASASWRSGVPAVGRSASTPGGVAASSTLGARTANHTRSCSALSTIGPRWVIVTRDRPVAVAIRRTGSQATTRSQGGDGEGRLCLSRQEIALPLDGLLRRVTLPLSLTPRL